MVGQQPLKLRILVRAQAPEPRKNHAFTGGFFVMAHVARAAVEGEPFFLMNGLAGNDEILS